jgi:hypothetical protein
VDLADFVNVVGLDSGILELSIDQLIKVSSVDRIEGNERFVPQINESRSTTPREAMPCWHSKHHLLPGDTDALNVFPLSKRSEESDIDYQISKTVQLLLCHHLVKLNIDIG